MKMVNRYIVLFLVTLVGTSLTGVLRDRVESGVMLSSPFVLAADKSEPSSREADSSPEMITEVFTIDPDLIVTCEGFEVKKALDEEARKTRFTLKSADGTLLTLWEGEWLALDYFDEQMRRVYDRREDHFRAFCANVIGPKKTPPELVVAFSDARQEFCCWNLDIYTLANGGGHLSQTPLKFTRPPSVEDLNKDGVDEIIVGDYRAYSIRELPREFAPHLQVALCVDAKGTVKDCTARFPVLVRQDITRLKKELAETSTTQQNATPKRRGLAIGIVVSYARLNESRKGLADAIKLCPERECKEWIQRMTPTVLDLLGGPAKYSSD